MATLSPEPSLTGPTTYTPSSTSFTPTTTTTGTKSSSDFIFPSYTTFPPFYTLQPNLQTQARQLDLWSSLILSYHRQHNLHKLTLTSPPPDLFTNNQIHRALKPSSIRQVLDHMSSTNSIEYLPSATKGSLPDTCYVYWRSPAEWADLIYGWVEETGQKGAVLTLYELREGDAVRGKEWKDMDEGLLRKVLGVLVKRGRAQMFGGSGEGGEGVKFF